MEDMKNDEKEYDLNINLLVLLAIAAVVVCIVFFFAVFRFIGSWEDRGLFGDMFGALNALFSGLAFAGVIYAILLQRKELSLQREELRLSRDELTQQTKVISAQLEAMQESFKYEKFKDTVSLKPKLQYLGGSFNNKEKKLNIYNSGGEFTITKFEVMEPKTKISIDEFSKYVGHNGELRLTLSGFSTDYTPRVEVVIEYKNKLGQTESIVGRIVEGRYCGFVVLEKDN